MKQESNFEEITGEYVSTDNLIALNSISTVNLRFTKFISIRINIKNYMNIKHYINILMPESKELTVEVTSPRSPSLPS